MKKKIWGKRVLLPGGWSSNTLIDIDQNGKIKDINKNVQPSNQVFDTLIPSPMNLHSHCFQRAMSGLSERSESKTNDFWSWRNFMYNFLNKTEKYLKWLKDQVIFIDERSKLHIENEI